MRSQDKNRPLRWTAEKNSVDATWVRTLPAAVQTFLSDQDGKGDVCVCVQDWTCPIPHLDVVAKPSPFRGSYFNATTEAHGRLVFEFDEVYTPFSLEGHPALIRPVKVNEGGPMGMDHDVGSGERGARGAVVHFPAESGTSGPVEFVRHRTWRSAR